MSLADVLKDLSDEEAKAVLQALDQYVENGQDVDGDPYLYDPLLIHGEAVLGRLNAYYAALADSVGYRGMKQ